MTNHEIEAMRKLKADSADMRAEISQLRHALSFYADAARYEGANQRVEAGDEFTPESMPYRLDVTRDAGEIARNALTPEHLRERGND